MLTIVDEQKDIMRRRARRKTLAVAERDETEEAAGEANAFTVMKVSLLAHPAFRRL